MDFIDELRQFSARVEKMRDRINTEEATKTSLILPFFQMLGYDIFNPDEFVPEFTADVGIKKGEKVDYAIMSDGDPLILIEAKQCTNNDLEKCASQLFRYFATTKSKFAILSNGINYLFYTDLDEPNKMDSKPFFEFNILDIKDSAVNELKKFRKDMLDIETILTTASELKYSSQIKQLMSKLMTNPSDEFINYILSEVYAGRRTQNVVDKFRGIVKSSLNQFVNELMNDRIKSALEKQTERQHVEEAAPTAEAEKTVEPTDSKIITTMEEMEAFFIVKSILREAIDPEKITYKDTQSYFGILLDNNTWKWICRFYLKENAKYMTVQDENKKERKYDISSINDIYKYKDVLLQALAKFNK